MSEQKQEAGKGWAKLSNSRKYHYFIEGRSLCGAWLAPWITHHDDSNHKSPDNCTGCKKIYHAEKPKEHCNFGIVE